MFKLPYDTTPCSNYVLKEIVSGLLHAAIENQLRPAELPNGDRVEDLYEVPPYLKTLPPFGHPISIERNGKTVWVIDTRAFVAQLRDGGFKVTSPIEHRQAILRAMASARWAVDGPDDFIAIGEIAPRVFIRLLAEGVVRRLGLTPHDQVALSAVTGFFYFSQFASAERFNEQEMLKTATRISRATMIPVEKVIGFIENLPILKSVFDYCEAVRKVVGSSRLEKFNPGLLYAIVGGNWFGANAREVLAVALEHPPTLHALIYIALTERSYHQSGLAKIVDSVNKGSLGKDFIANFVSLMEAPVNV